MVFLLISFDATKASLEKLLFEISFNILPSKPLVLFEKPDWGEYLYFCSKSMSLFVPYSVEKFISFVNARFK